ncbi:unnamed protein product [Ectocarpus sp. 12 AP-2014]
MRHVIEHSRFPRQLKEVEYTVRNSRSKDLRESVGAYVLLMLRAWPPASMDKEAGHLESIIGVLLRDASSAARTDARSSFGMLMEHWPKRADKVLQGAFENTLRRGMGLLECSALVSMPSGGLHGGASTKSSSATASGGRLGGTSRASKAGGVGGGGSMASKGARKGPSSSEALRAAESAGNGPAPSPPQHRATNASAAARRGAKKATTSASTTGASAHTPPPASAAAAAAAARRRRNALGPSSTSSPGSAAAGGGDKATGASPSGHAKNRRPTNPSATVTEAALASVAKSPASGGTTSGGGGGGGGLSKPKRAGGGGGALPAGVCLQGQKKRAAVVRYVGETQFATGVWVGVELSPDADPPGNNDGSVRGVSYFKCPPLCGVFAKPDMFELLEEEEEGEGDADGDDVEMSAREDGQTATTGGSDEATRAGGELLRFHKLFANEALEALKEEMAMIPDLEGLVESKQSAPADCVRFYLEVLESAAGAREAAAARLRAQIRETAERYPSVFSPSPDDAAAAASSKGGRGSSSGSTDAGSGPGGGAPQSDDGPGDGDGGGGASRGDRANGGEDGNANDNNGAAASGETEEDESVADTETVAVEADDGDAADTSAAAAVGEDEGGPTDGGSSRSDDKGARGQAKGNGGNVFGMVGKFLLGVVHKPPGGGEEEEGDQGQACQQKETHGEGAAGSGSAAPVASTPTMDAPSIPNAIGKGAPFGLIGKPSTRSGTERSRKEIDARPVPPD